MWQVLKEREMNMRRIGHYAVAGSIAITFSAIFRHWWGEPAPLICLIIGVIVGCIYFSLFFPDV